jgi:hypothetical protein
MLRVVKTNTGEVFVDKSGKADGRGVYICNNSDCIAQAVKKRGLNRAFKGNVANDIYTALESEDNV